MARARGNLVRREVCQESCSGEFAPRLVHPETGKGLYKVVKLEVAVIKYMYIRNVVIMPRSQMLDQRGRARSVYAPESHVLHFRSPESEDTGLRPNRHRDVKLSCLVNLASSNKHADELHPGTPTSSGWTPCLDSTAAPTPQSHP